MTGRFVVLEGGEGSGKSTQVPRLASALRELGRDVIVTFEPGATGRGAQLREVLLADHSPLHPRAELLLLVADRAQHVAEVVRPALERGIDVVSDRFSPSTLAYQGVARGLGVDAIQPIIDWAAEGLEPDVVVVLDVPDEVADARVPSERDRLEGEGVAFHAAVRRAYRELAPARGWVVVDGAPAPEQVAIAVWDAVRDRLGL